MLTCRRSAQRTCTHPDSEPGDRDAGGPPERAPGPAVPDAGLPNEAGAAWLRAGPPSRGRRANQFLAVVPLLHAAAGRLSPDALAQWRADSRSWWDAARHDLASAPATRPATLLAALELAPEAASAALLAVRLQQAVSVLPSGAMVHLPWVTNVLALPDGYIPAPGQEACLQVFGGLSLASSLEGRSEAFRRSPPAAAAPAPRDDGTCLTTAAPRRRRRRRRASSAEAHAGPGRVDGDSGRPHGGSSDMASGSLDEAGAPPALLPDAASSSDRARSDGAPLRVAQRAASVAARVPRAAWVGRSGCRFFRASPYAPKRAVFHACWSPPRVVVRTPCFALPLSSRGFCSRVCCSRAGLRPTVELVRLRFFSAWRTSTRGDGPRCMTRQWLPGLDRPPRLPLRTRPGASAPAPKSSAEICLGPARRSRPPLWRQATRPPCLAGSRAPTARAVPRVHLSAAAVADSLRTAKKGAAAGLSGATAEHYKLLLADEEALAQFAEVAMLLANGDVPRRYAARFDEATRPFQFALQARAGTDCLATMLRVAVELDPEATVVSLDGRSAYDCVSRAAFLRKLEEVAPALLPFVRGFYARQSVYLRWDSQGVCHRILHGEGCEQGGPLAPALCALAQHDGLAAASQGLRSGDRLAAFLDDLYVFTTASRARDSIDAVTGAVEEYAGVSSNLGKTRVYSRAGSPRHCRAWARGVEWRQTCARAWLRRFGRAHRQPRVRRELLW